MRLAHQSSRAPFSSLTPPTHLNGHTGLSVNETSCVMKPSILRLMEPPTSGWGDHLAQGYVYWPYCKYVKLLKQAGCPHTARLEILCTLKKWLKGSQFTRILKTAMQSSGTLLSSKGYTDSREEDQCMRPLYQRHCQWPGDHALEFPNAAV